ncbi:MAG TPA: VOC family protein [Thermomicrobiales bacterium]|nr:VOC family protein [Thermomicrobiales bacterium]
MQTHVHHLQFNVQPDNLPFYRDVLAFLGWTPIHDDATALGVAGPGGQGSLWFLGIANDAANDYDGPGLNHFAFGVDAQGDVDEAVAWLRDRGVDLLWETPRHREEFSGDDATYYQAMFESPDRIQFEIVYTGPKAA